MKHHFHSFDADADDFLCWQFTDDGIPELVEVFDSARRCVTNLRQEIVHISFKHLPWILPTIDIGPNAF